MRCLLAKLFIFAFDMKVHLIRIPDYYLENLMEVHELLCYCAGNKNQIQQL